MAEVRWIKLVTDMFNNRKIKQIKKLPEGDAIIVIWLQILCLAGQTNDNGMVYFSKDIPYTDEMLAVEFDRSIGLIRLALATFEKFNMIEIIDDILLISNWEKYQSADKLQQIRENNRLRQQRYKEKQKLLPKNNVSITSQVTQGNAIELELDIDKELDKDKDKRKKIVLDLSPLEKTINDFIDFRKGIKAKMGDRAVELLRIKLDKLADNDEEKIKILEQSIMNGWKSVYELKGGTNGSYSTSSSEHNQNEGLAERAGVTSL